MVLVLPLRLNLFLKIFTGFGSVQAAEGCGRFADRFCLRKLAEALQ